MSNIDAANITPALLNESRLTDLLNDGPTLHSTASQLLRTALKTTFPQQQIDPDNALIATPEWRQEGDDWMTDSNEFESLTHALLRQAFTQMSANYIEGEHFLTVTPDAIDPIHLPFSMDAITNLLNEYAPQLFVGFGQSQLDYWNEPVEQVPRWQSLAEKFKTALDVEMVTGWDADQCTLARFIAEHPDKASRPLANSKMSNVGACLLDLEQTLEMPETSNSRHLMVADALVLTATLDDRELIAMYSVADGYESFDSMAQLGAALPERIGIDMNGQTLTWRLYEPEGDIFSALAWAAVASELDATEALDAASSSPLAGQTFQADGRPISVHDNVRIQQLERAIPTWLTAGSLADMQAYSGYLTELGLLRSGSDNFDAEEIPLIHDYAQQQMCDAIIAEKSIENPASLLLNDIRITVTPSFQVGGFTLPDHRHRSVETLGEFALHNIRPYIPTVAYADGSAAPDWMTGALLTRIASKVNVGENYPLLIKHTLIDTPDQARRHKARYCRQLPFLLPLLALECKLRQQGDVDEQGYQQVCQLMTSIESQTPPAEWPVQIRPLAFIPRLRLDRTADTVANMYIIAPREGSNGPCLLYRPLLEPALRQFPSVQNMLYAFYQAGELRDSVLAWLADRAQSFDYAQYVFSSGIPSLWTIPDLAFEPLIHLDLSASVELANSPLTGNILETLYARNSQAMVELADRQSTSNGERRWAMLVESAWAVFSISANFLSGPAGTAVWVWQTIGQIQQVLDAQEQEDSFVEWTSTGDVLLTLGILLTQIIATRRLRLTSPPHELAASEKTLPPEPSSPIPLTKISTIVIHQAPPLSADLPTLHLSSLTPDVLTPVSAGARFLKLIDQLQSLAPALPDDAKPNSEHLYEVAGKQFAQVGERWFQIRAEPDEPVSIIDPNDPDRAGMCVKYDQATNRWNWDLKLRLRGGGPTSRLKALQLKKLNKRLELQEELNVFCAQELMLDLRMDEALRVMEGEDTTSPVTEQDVSNSISTSNDLANQYTHALESLEQWREAGGSGVLYQSRLMRFTFKLHRYLNSWLRMTNVRYRHAVAGLANLADAPVPMSRAERIQAATKAIEISTEMMDCQTRLDTSLEKLSGHSGNSSKLAADLRRIKVTLSRTRFQANEISLSSELSLREVPANDHGPIRQLVMQIFGNAAAAGHALEERPKDPNYQPPDIEQLTALVDRLADSEQRVQELAVDSPERFDATRLSRVRLLVAGFHQQARSRLRELLPEPEELPLVTTPKAEPVPSTSRAVAKVRKSRPRMLESKKTASISKPEADDAPPIIKSANRRKAQTETRNDEDTLTNATRLNAEANAFVIRTRVDAQRPERAPADMQDLFDQQASRLEQAATEIDALVERKKLLKLPIALLGEKLRADAAHTRREGATVYGAMLMSRKPRVTYLQWLYEHDQVEIVKDPRGRILTKLRKDYFQEYKISNKTRDNQPLWVAHFHYEHLTDADHHFTAAHLKPAEEYLRDQPPDTRRELNSFDYVDNALRRIDSPAVADLFLQAKPTPSE